MNTGPSPTGQIFATLNPAGEQVRTNTGSANLSETVKRKKWPQGTARVVPHYKDLWQAECRARRKERWWWRTGIPSAFLLGALFRAWTA